MSNVIEVKELTKVFYDFWHRPTVRALKGIDLTVEEGAVFGFLGPNGSGKSTTIKILLGLLKATSGDIKVLGKKSDNVAVKKHIGFLPEETYLYPYLTPVETLKFYGKLFNLSGKKLKLKMEELLDLTGLSNVSNRKVGSFSKGMRRRLGLAQSLLNDPKLLVLDEPTSGLDPIGCKEVKNIISDLSKEGTTVFMSSHLLADVEDICTKAAILYQGEVQAVGTLTELLSEDKRKRIVFPDVKEETLAQIKEILLKEIDKNELVVDKPVKKLEAFFLDVVNKAGRKE